MKTLIQGGTVVTATEVFCGDVLTDGEQKEWVMICCARSKSSMIVLDL